MSKLHFIVAGMAAGAISAYSFALIHALLISDIWFSLPLLLAAGAICGLCLGWTYGLLFEAPSIRTWMQFNALYVGMFVLLGVASVLIFEPVTTLAAVMAVNEPPGDLFNQAMPLTILSTLLMAAIIGKLYARKWVHYAATLLTCAVLVALLGLNVSVIGLIAIPRSASYLILELAGLILSLNLVFAVVFALLEWKTFFGSISRVHLPAEKH